MEKPVQEIHQSLQKLIGLHRQLLEIVRLEHEALVQADRKGLEEATVAKQAVIEAIKQAESLRVRQVADLALAWKKPIRELTLSNVIIAVQGEDAKGAEQLRSALNALTVLVQRAKEQNDSNRDLVEESLVHVNNMKRNVLGESAPKTDTYTPYGQKTSSGGSSRLISKEA